MGCRTTSEKSELIRIVRTPEGGVRIDPTGRMNGRGAYLCRNENCLKRVLKSGALARSLKTPIPGEVAETLRKEIRV